MCEKEKKNVLLLDCSLSDCHKDKFQNDVIAINFYRWCKSRCSFSHINFSITL